MEPYQRDRSDLAIHVGAGLGEVLANFEAHQLAITRQLNWSIGTTPQRYRMGGLIAPRPRTGVGI
jgi:hypothetical protein